MLKVRLPDGRMVEAEDLDFESVKEEWNEYKLEDGTVLKAKLVVSKVLRAKEYQESGEPIYTISSANVVRAKVPEELIKKSEEREFASK